MYPTVIDRLCPPSPPKLFPPDLSDRRVQDIAIAALLVFGGILLLWLGEPTLEHRSLASTISAGGCVVILISYYSKGPEPKPPPQKQSLAVVDLLGSRLDPTDLENAYEILGIPEGKKEDKESILDSYERNMRGLGERKKGLAVISPSLAAEVQKLMQECEDAFQTIKKHLGDPWPSSSPLPPRSLNDLD